jgi:hypothetical protein
MIKKRNNIFRLTEIDEEQKKLYKGLYQWLKDNGEDLQNRLHEGSGFFAEWIGMGQIKYDFNTRVFMFAKANIDDEMNVYNIYYDLELLKYPFIDAEVPEYVKLVPQVDSLELYPNIEFLDQLYDEYCEFIERNVEGFIIHQNGVIKKYVRMKNGKLQAHKE